MDNRSLIVKMFNDLKDGHRSALLKLLAEDCEWVVTGTSPVSGTYSNRESFYKNALQKIRSQLTDDVVPEVQEVICEGKRLVVRWRGKSEAISGMRYDNHYCWILEIENKQIVKGIIYCDTALVSDLLKSSTKE